MGKCLKCGEEAKAYTFACLEILTFHVRDLNGQRKIQAVGEHVELTVCKACAQARLDHQGAVARKRTLPMLLLLILGAAAFLLLRSREELAFFGYALLAGGVIAFFSAAYTQWRGILEKKKLPPEQALRQTAWELALEQAPKKAAENDITYLPIDETTMGYKNGDLMVAFDLVPEIAIQVYEKLHGLQKEKSGEEK